MLTSIMQEKLGLTNKPTSINLKSEDSDLYNLRRMVNYVAKTTKDPTKSELSAAVLWFLLCMTEQLVEQRRIRELTDRELEKFNVVTAPLYLLGAGSAFKTAQSSDILVYDYSIEPPTSDPEEDKITLDGQPPKRHYVLVDLTDSIPPKTTRSRYTPVMKNTNVATVRFLNARHLFAAYKLANYVVSTGHFKKAKPELPTAVYTDGYDKRARDKNYLDGPEYEDKTTSFKRFAYQNLNTAGVGAVILLAYMIPIKRTSTIGMGEEAVMEQINLLYAQEINYKLMESYAKGVNADYARAFQTKKNIKKTHLERMQQTDFLKKGFKFVELDNDVDLAKLNVIEREWSAIYSQLPKTSAATLRFRKLGNRRAAGVYFPYYDCVSVDVSSIYSFCHEYGHHLDYTTKDKTCLSLQTDFLAIVTDYRTALKRLAPKMTRPELQYFGTPTEVFARGFELYLLITRKMKTALLGTMEQHAGPEYKAFKASDLDRMLAYFGKLYGNK